MRFCSSCGLPLNIIAEVLANGGQLHWRPPEPVQRQLSPRQKGIRQGVILMLSSLLVMPIVVILGVAILRLPSKIIPLVASILVMGGLLRVIYAAMFEEATTPGPPAHAAPPYAPPPVQPYLNTPAHNAALPPTPDAPPYGYRPPQRYNTGELQRRPPSVTESTTRLLDHDQPDEPRRG